MRLPGIVHDGGDLAAAVARLAKGRADLVTFDVFDTLLLRRCHPGTIQDAAIARMATLTGVSREICAAARIRAHECRCATTVTAGGDRECGIRHWYRLWASLVLGGNPGAEAVADAIVEYELNLEADACDIDPRAMEAVRSARESGARSVIAVSDMYLSSTDIARLLGPAAGELDGIYTSGDVGLLKRTGRLFHHVRKAEGVGAGRHLHIGDDLLADAVRPAMQGAATLLLRDGREVRKRVARYARSHRAGPSDLARDAFAYAVSGDAPLDDAETIGLSTFGPILVPFIQGVAERCRRDGIERVFFLAREGLVLKAAYDAVAGEGSPPSAYLCVSRYTSLLAQMTAFGPIERDAMAANMAVPTPRRLLEVIGITPESLDGACAAYGLDPDEPVDAEDTRLADLCVSPAIAETAAGCGTAVREGLSAHLRETGFLGAGRVAIVDVGWGGQIQENLCRLGKSLEGFPDVAGYYFGLNERATRRIEAGLQMVGVVTERWSCDWKGAAIFDFVMALEASTRAPHGSTVGYGADGTPVFAGKDSPGRREEAADDPILAGIQRGILRFAERYARHLSWRDTPSDAAIDISRSVAARLVRFPNALERRVFRGLVNVSNLGSSEVLPYVHRDLTWLRPIASLKRARWSLWQEAAAGILLGRLGQVLFQGAKAILMPPEAIRAPVRQRETIAVARAVRDPGPGRDALHARLLSDMMAMAPSGTRSVRQASVDEGRLKLALGWLAHATGSRLRARRPMEGGRLVTSPWACLAGMRHGAAHASLIGQGIAIAEKVLRKAR